MAAEDAIVIGTRQARLRTATFTDIRASFAAGWADFKAAPLHGLSIGAFYAFGGLLILYIAVHLGYPYMAAPITAGFTLLGPFAAIELYEISRIVERGETVTWRKMRDGLTPSIIRECAYLGLLLFVIFAMWVESSFVLYALFFGLNIMSFSAFFEAIHHFIRPIAFGGKAAIAAIFPAELVFWWPSRIHHIQPHRAATG